MALGKDLRKNKKNSLPSARLWHLAKKKNSLPSDADVALGKEVVTVDGGFFCRVLTWHSAKALPSAQHMALGKETFADGFFVECKTTTLGKHSAKSPSAVVNIIWKFNALGEYSTRSAYLA
jgi:hypothetical protein